MKVLQVNCVYNTGSTGNVTADLHHALPKRGIESVVCYGRGGKTDEKHVYKTCGELYSKFCHLLTCFDGVMYGKCFFSTHKLIHIIKKEKPDIVHLQCINGYFVNIYAFVQWLNKHNIKTVLTLHAEFMYTANCGHALECEQWIHGCQHCSRYRRETKSFWFDRTAASWKKMQKAFDGFQNLQIVSVSEWLRSRAERSDILKSFPHRVIYNGIDTTVFKRNANTAAIRKQHGIADSTKVVLHVTASFSSPLKGGKYILELAEKSQGQDVCFVIIGNKDTSISFPANVIDVGRVEDREMLAAYYSMADLSVIASERETFSMPVAESLCCGTPVVGFKAGAPEQIALREYSAFVEYGDTDALYVAMQQMLCRSFDRERIAENAAERYGSENMVAEYVRLYDEMKENL